MYYCTPLLSCILFWQNWNHCHLILLRKHGMHEHFIENCSLPIQLGFGWNLKRVISSLLGRSLTPTEIHQNCTRRSYQKSVWTPSPYKNKWQTVYQKDKLYMKYIRYSNRFRNTTLGLGTSHLLPFERMSLEYHLFLRSCGLPHQQLLQWSFHLQEHLLFWNPCVPDEGL